MEPPLVKRAIRNGLPGLRELRLAVLDYLVMAPCKASSRSADMPSTLQRAISLGVLFSRSNSEPWPPTWPKVLTGT